MCKTQMGCHKAMKSWGLLGLRVALAIVLISVGYAKLGPVHEGTVMVMGKYFPGNGAFWATLVGLLEFVGGFMILLGVYAPFAAAWQSVIVIVAMLTVHRGGPLTGYFLPLLVLGGCLSLMGTGAGKLRLVKMQCCCPKCKAGCMVCGSADCGSGGCGGGSCGGGVCKPGDMPMNGMDMKKCMCKGCCGGNCGCGGAGGACTCCKK